MMVFIVPVKSKSITPNWGAFSSLVDRCINSICNQINTNFKVIIVCHEIPKTKFVNDPRVVFLNVDFPRPILNNNANDIWIQRTDKGKKIKIGANYAIKMGASYVMTVDSDDCVSNKISEFVCKKQTNSTLGWYVKKGYLYPEGKRYLYLNLKNFHTVCGSCVIIKPEYIDLMYGRNFWFDHKRTIFDNGLSLVPLPFPGSLYSMLNGSNIRLNFQEMEKRTKFVLFDFKSIKTLFRRLLKYRLIPLKFIKKEFLIYDI